MSVLVHEDTKYASEIGQTPLFYKICWLQSLCLSLVATKFKEKQEKPDHFVAAYCDRKIFGRQTAHFPMEMSLKII